MYAGNDIPSCLTDKPACYFKSINVTFFTENVCDKFKQAFD